MEEIINSSISLYFVGEGRHQICKGTERKERERERTEEGRFRWCGSKNGIWEEGGREKSLFLLLSLPLSLSFSLSLGLAPR